MEVSLQQQRQVFQVQAPIPAGGVIYQGNLAGEEGGSLSCRARKRQQLYSSNLEIIRRKLAKIDHEAKREIEETAGGKGKAKKKSVKKVKKGNKEREEFWAALRIGQIGQNNEKAYQMRSKFCSQCGPNADQY